jgi:hypothetical protein
MDYWTSFLKKRADEDIAMYDNFEISRDLRLKYIFIRIKDGKLKYNRINPEFDYANKMADWILQKMDVKNLPDCVIPLYTGDSYGWEDEHIHFCWSKPEGKKGILFPSWEFRDWDKTKRDFVDKYIPWTEREVGPYFIGRNTSKPFTNIREIVKDLYPEHVKLLDETKSEDVARQTLGEPSTNLMKYKLAFDLAGKAPWSIRSPLIDLAGCSSVRILNYYPKWDEGIWYQFYEDIKNINGIHLQGNYRNPIPQSKVPELKKLIDKEITSAIKRHARAKANRERMLHLTTDHMVNYLEYIFTEVGKRQNL